MMVIAVYDIDTTDKAGEKRLQKVAKQCKNKGRRVQASVFECELNEDEFRVFKGALLDILEPQKDSIIFYRLGNHWNSRIESLGKETQRITDYVI